MSRLLTHGCALLPILSEMELHGMPADRDYFRQLDDDMTTEMDVVRERISARYFGGRPFNPKSTRHVTALLLRRGLKPQKRTKTGAVSTSKASIQYLRYEDESIREVFEWRERQHVRDSFCRPIVDRVGRDGSVHCRIKPTRIPTRRLATTDPNLLAQPARTPLGRRVRAGFRTEGDEVFYEADLSQIELRVAAHVSGDPVLTRAYLDGEDIHEKMRQAIFAKSKGDGDQRTAAKTFNFQGLYLGGAEGMRIQLWSQGLTDWTLDRCNRALKARRELYAGLTEYEREVERDIERDGYVEDMWGMRRYLPGIWAVEKSIRAEAIRQGLNHRIQGGAQGMLQNSMLWLRPRIWAMQQAGANVKFRLSVHDSVLFTCDDTEVAELDELVVEALTEHCGVELSVPVEAEGKVGVRWDQLK